MKLLADSNIPFVHQLFGLNNQICLRNGRLISNKDLEYIDLLIIRSVTKINHVLLYNSSVKFIGTTTSGVDHVDQNYLKKNNIFFASAPGSNSISVVEYVLSALFWIAQRDQFFLKDKTVGIIGVGHIGSLLNERLKNFGIHTLLCDPYLFETDINKNWKPLDKLIAESDILTFHIPLTYKGRYPTWHMVNLDLLDALPNSSILINTSRGEVIDNVALLKVLQCRKKISVILDVWESEPNLLWELFSYIDLGTAHIAGHTIESKIRGVMQIYSKYCNYFNIPNVINLSDSLDSIINYIEINKIDEYSINKIIKSIYNIYNDHLALKNCINNFAGFDTLRKNYFRREWSSVYIRSNKDYNNELLMSLGFNVII